MFKANRAMTLKAASFAQELNADGDKTVQIHNATASKDLTTALDADALGALDSSAFTLTATTADLTIASGDFITLVYTVATAGSVACGESSVAMLWEPVEDSPIAD